MVYRSGQKNPVHVYKLIAKNTMEERIFETGSLKDDKPKHKFDDEHLNKLRDIIQFSSDAVSGSSGEGKPANLQNDVENK